MPQVGLTTFRMPYTPVSFGSFAGFARGELFDPVRTTPMHDWAARHGAVFENVGLWKRARYFPAAWARTCTPPWRANASRCATHCGIFDGSTLGKIEVVGKDAATFMNRMYVNAGRASPSAAAATAFCCGTTASSTTTASWPASADDRFHVTTTTGGAPRRARADGGLPPDGMARSQRLAHLDHRAVGRDRRAGPERAPRAGAARGGHRHLGAAACRT